MYKKIFKNVVKILFRQNVFNFFTDSFLFRKK